MTLNEAIRHANDVAATADCEECREQHIQLAAWLEELADARSRRVNDIPVDAVEVVRCKDCVKDGLTTCPLCYIEKKTLVFINHDPYFYCGFGERREIE